MVVLNFRQRAALEMVLRRWLWWEWRHREIARRPYGIFNGEIKGELLYHAPEAIR